ILYIIFKNKLFDFRRSLWKPKLWLLFIMIIGHFTVIKLLPNEGIYSDYNLYNKVNSISLMINRFGVITAMRLDLKRTLFGFDGEDSFIEIIDRKGKEDVEDITYNVLDINWTELINNENNTTIKQMHEYFSGIVPTNKNEYTGLFKGKNLVWIVAEALDHIAIDKDITPTLYKILQEGYNFTNYYAPIYLSTIDGEFATITGLLPRGDGKISMYYTHDNYMPFSLALLLKEYGYKATAYHNGQATYYRRHISHPNFGYEYFGCGRGLDINCKLWPQSDLEMVEATVDSYINLEQPFLTYYFTISGHLRYNHYNQMAIKNWSYVKDLPYSDAVKCYLSQHVELDKAVAKLILSLEEAGIAEDTVIAISSDHWPYGLTEDNLNEKSDINRKDHFDRDRSPFIIWHKGIEGQKIKKIGSNVDIVPTLANLFGLEYDSRLLMGRDLFSDAESIVIFQDRSWITEKGRYNMGQKNFISNNGKVDNDYINRINSTIYNRFYITRLILEHDYYRKLFK
ncbi:MAG: LTA synthase family protein, partial [Bacilli bacterium]|nr:LTA synthase family protein [Bacilli bacterium]